MSMGGSAGDQLTLYTVQPITEYIDGSCIDTVRAAPGVDRASPQLCLAIPNAPYDQVVGFDPDTHFTEQPRAHTGEPDALKGGEAMVGSLVGTSALTSVTILGQQFPIVERLDRTGTSVDRTAFVRLDDLALLVRSNANLSAQIGEGEVSAIMIKMATGAGQDEVSAALELEEPQYSTVAASRLASNIASQLSGIGSSLSLTALVVAVVVVPQVALVSTMVSNERRGEYGMLRALGGTKRYIFGMVFGESLLIALLGGLLGVAGTGLTFLILERQLGAAFLGPFLWPSAGAIVGDVAIALGIALIIGALSAIYPAYVSSRRDPYQVIKTGGGR